MHIPTTRQMRVLARLSRNRELPGSELIDGINRSTAYTAMTKLVGRGWVSARRAPSTEREKLYKITVAGRRAYLKALEFTEGK